MFEDEEETIGGLTAAEQGDEMALDYQNPADVARAIQRSSAEQRAYLDGLAAELKAKRYGPTASERLFALSAAFAAPTSTRGFGGVMSNVMPVFQQFEKSKRDAEEARAADMQKLQMARMGATQAEINSALTLQKLQAQYNKPVRGVAVGDQLKNPYTGEVIGGGGTPAPTTVKVGDVEYLTTAGGRPSTPVPERNKFRAATPEEAAMYGAKSGQINIATGEFKPVTQAPQAPRKLSATEQRELFETESVIGGGQETLVKLQRLLELNPTSLEGSLTGVRKKVGQLFNSDDPAYLAAEEIDNLAKELALGELKTTFPGAISNDERKVLVELKGSASMPRAVRERIWKKAIPVVQRLLQRNTQRLEKLKSGYYSTQGGTSSSAPPRVIRFDRNGNRI